MSNITEANPIPLITAYNTKSDVYIGKIGVKETISDTRITYINGIRSQDENCYITAMMISCFHKYTQVHFVCDRTQGLIKDLIIASALMAGFDDHEAVDKLAQLWQGLIASMGGMDNPSSKIIHYAHSRGGLVTALALEKLTVKERQRLFVTTFGSPVVIKHDKCAGLRMVMNRNDPVPFLHPKRLYSCFTCTNSSLSDIHLHSSSKIMEHSILDTAYRDFLSSALTFDEITEV